MIFSESLESEFFVTVNTLHADLGKFFKPLSSCVSTAITKYCGSSPRFMKLISGVDLIGILFSSRSHFSARFLPGFLYVSMISKAAKVTKALFIFTSPFGNRSFRNNGAFFWMPKLVSFFCGAIHLRMFSPIAFSCRRLFSRIFTVVSSAICPTFFVGHGAILT